MQYVFPVNSLLSASQNDAYFTLEQSQTVHKNLLLLQIRLFNIITALTKRSEPGSSVSAVSDYGLEGRDSIPDRGGGFFL
jgi:hypothetical protein